MNIQTIERVDYWVLDGSTWLYKENQKTQLEKAWADIEEANEGGVLRNLSYALVVAPVVRNALVMHTKIDENAAGGEWNTAYCYFSNCVLMGLTPSWKWDGYETKYLVGSGLYRTKEKAVAARVQQGDVTPELLIELAEWLKEEM